MKKEEEKKRITLFFPIDLLEKVDCISRKNYTKRSNWIMQTIIDKIKDEKMQ